MNLGLSYMINKKLDKESRQIFEGIARGRKRALENWFNDKWTELELVRDNINAYLDENEVDLGIIKIIMEDKKCSLKIF
jgi:hypothetical protein